MNAKLSARMALEGAHDFSAHPVAPPGCEITVHQTIDQMTSWGLNGIKGWYLGPSYEHYRCHKVYIPATRGERVASTVDFHTKNSRLPHISAEEAATQAAKDLTAALQQHKQGAPFAPVGDAQLNAIRELASIFEELTAPQKNRDQGNKEPQQPAPRVEKKQPAPMVQKKQVVPRVDTTTSKHESTQPNIIEDDRQTKAPVRKQGPNMAPRPHRISVPTAKMSGPLSSHQKKVRSLMRINIVIHTDTPQEERHTWPTY